MIQKNISLKQFNTFGIEAQASHFLRIDTISGLQAALQKSDAEHPVIILGGGSNVLLTGDLQGLVLKNELKGIEILKREEGAVEIAVASGENWHEFVLWTLENNMAGLENLSLIPGTVGAAPIQNIGAYGVELKDVFLRLEAIDLTNGETRIFHKEECRFGYRDSVFKRELKGKYFITKVVLRLQEFEAAEVSRSYGAINSVLEREDIKSPTPRDISSAVIEIRSSKLPDPKKLGNAGSFFKNPVITAEEFSKVQNEFPEIIHYALPDGTVKVPAGWLIEHAGWKGRRVGNTGAHAKQALVLVNYGGVKGQEVKELSEQIIQSVKDKYGISLEREVNIW